MAYLSLAEAARLSLARPELVSRVTKVMARFEAETGRRTKVPNFGGLRSPEEQARLVADRQAAGNTYRVASPSVSRHPLGAAADLHIIADDSSEPAARRAGHEFIGHPLYRILGRIAEEEGLAWGGRWKPQPDDYHIELRETLEESRAAWAELTRRRLWRLAIVVAVALAVILSTDAS